MLANKGYLLLQNAEGRRRIIDKSITVTHWTLETAQVGRVGVTS